MSAESKKEKSSDPLQIISEVGGMLSTLKGVRKPEGPPKEKLRPIRKDKLGAQKKEQDTTYGLLEERRMEPKSDPETKEWTKEVIDGLEGGRLPPELKIQQQIAVSRHIIQKSQPEIAWLVKGDAPTSDLVSQAVADIATSKLKDDPEYLLAKGAQLRWSINPSEMPLDIQAEALTVLTRIHIKVDELARRSPPPERDLGKIANHHLIRHEFTPVLNQKLTGTIEESPKSKRSKSGEEGSVKEDKTVSIMEKQDMIAYVNEELIKMAHGNDEVLDLISKRPITSPDVAEFVGSRLQEGKSLVDIAEELADAYFDRSKPLDVQRITEARKILVVTAALTNDPEVFEKLAIRGGAGRTPPKIWNGTLTGNKDLDNLLQKIQNQFNNVASKVDDLRFVDESIDRIAGFSPTEIAAAGTDPLRELQTLLVDLRAEAARQYRGESIDQPWSSFMLNPERRKQLVLYPEWAYMRVYRQINLTVDFFAEGSLTDAMEMEVRQMAQYFASASYETDVRGVMQDYGAEVESAYGVRIDVNNPESHPFYQDRVRRLKDVSDRINSQEHLLRTYGVAKYGLEMQKVAQAAANLGDSGVFRIKMNNGGLTGLAYHLYDSMGMDMGISDEHGKVIRVTGREVELLKAKVRQTFRDNREALGEIYKKYWEQQSKQQGAPQQAEKAMQGIEGKLGVSSRNVELTDDAIEGIIREAEMLYTVTLRDVAMTDRGLSPWEGRGQNEQSVQYAGTRGIELVLRGRSPIRWLINRWDILPPTGQLHLRVMAHEYAVASGVELGIEDLLDLAGRDPEYKRELAEYALNITEQKDPEKRRQTIQEALGFHFGFDRQGHKITLPPKVPTAEEFRKLSLDSLDKVKQKLNTVLEGLTRGQLKEILMYKEGVKYADAVLGNYDYEGATWVVEEKLKQYRRIYGEDLAKIIGLSDRKRHIGKGLLSAEGPHDLESVQDTMVYGEHGESGVLRVMADYMPDRHFQDMMEHHDYDTRRQFRKWVTDGLFQGVFTEKLADGSIRAVVVGSDRPDIVYKGLKRVRQITDELLAHDGGGPVNYAAGPTPEQRIRLEQVCKGLGINTDKYLAAMNTISGYVLQNHNLEKLVQPEYFDTYRLTQDLDAREKYLDKPKDAPGSKYEGGETLVSAQIEIKASSEIGGEKGKGLQSGLGRVINDDAGTTDNATLLANKILGARSEKQLMEAMPEFAMKILYTAGGQTKARGAAIVAGSWAKCARMDPVKDWSVLGSAFDEIQAASPFQRVGVKGDHGDPSLSLNEIHKFWVEVQKAANVTFHRDIHWLNSEIERDLGLIWKVKPPFFKKHVELGIPLTIYRSYLALLIGLGILSAKVVETGQEELSGEKRGR